MDRNDGKPKYRSLDGLSSPVVQQAKPKIQLQRPVPAMVKPIRPSPAKQSLPNNTSDKRQPLPSEPTFKYSYSPYTDKKPPSPISLRPKKIKHKWSTKRKVVSIILIILLTCIGLGGWYGSRLVGNLDKVFHGNIFSDTAALFSSSTVRGESQGRVNILLAGDSADQIGHGGASLTDSVLVLSINTDNHTAFLLSIPRDLWVYVSGLNSWQKINAANNVTGFNQAGYPSGGMGQLQEIVQTDLGIPIDYYGLMDYGAFEQAVNAVGGVSINIQSPDPRGLYDPNVDLRLPNGWINLNGQEALNLARARGDGPGSYGFPASDFDRTEHQRQLFIAVASKAETLGVITNPVKVNNLFNAFGNNLQTDLSLQNVLTLIKLTKGVNTSNIKSYSYCSTITVGQNGCTKPLLTGYTDPSSGQEALIPAAGIGNYGQMEQYYQLLTSNNPIAKEQPSVVILNGSDVVGLSKQQETVLEAKGYSVASIADATNEYPDTMIINNSNGNKPNSLKELQQLYPGTTVTSDTGTPEAEEARGYNADFVVVLGENWGTAKTIKN
jgi:LCP family protein required for cell wall assembly